MIPSSFASVCSSKDSSSSFSSSSGEASVGVVVVGVLLVSEEVSARLSVSSIGDAVGPGVLLSSIHL